MPILDKYKHTTLVPGINLSKIGVILNSFHGAKYNLILILICWVAKQYK